MFKSLPPKLNLTLLEEEVLRFWKSHRIFEKSARLHEGKPNYVFYEGPPTANGPPGVHHALARSFKDVFPRFHSMRGNYIIRRGGWDTHGLPVEIEVEKKLGFSDKSQIEAFGIDNFNELCRQSVFEYIHEWEKFTDRLGYWVDLGDAYITYTNDYIESVWWILKSLWEKGLLYEGYKVVPYCPRCGTPLSEHEVAQGYDQVTDPSVFVRLPLVEDPGTSLLVWTTTPWTLPGNAAVAAHPNVEYVIIEKDLPEGGSERLILAKALLEKVFGDQQTRLGQNIRVHETFKGRKLKGIRYRPLYQFLAPNKPAHYVVLEEFVTTEDGTGLVHIAPAFGAEDMQAAMEYDLPILMTVGPDGAFIPEVKPWRGKFVKDADPLIIQDLDGRGLLLKSDTCTHSYPFCWRCSTPLLYYARSTWFVKTSRLKEKMIELNQHINWQPAHIKNGRFGNWLENNIDWALGRERYWGTPLPIWECETCRHQLAVGSISELSELSENEIGDIDLHRPAIDKVYLPCPECKGQMKRVLEVIDAWFDSGSMPVAQWHYPFENQEIFDRQFPADFISEGVDQTRGWFYSLHAISTLLFEKECFRNVLCLGLVLDSEGQKMSTSRGNILDPWNVLHEFGADAFRWYLYTSGPPGMERRFSMELVGEVVRNFTLILWNVYSFFVTYARLDRWRPGVGQIKYNELDRWLRSELHVLIREVTKALENYDVPGATRPLQAFVDLLSRWYLRRSRRRFWKSGSNADKNAAYTVLYDTLVILSKLLAPTMPFMAEELHQNLVRSIDTSALESVHLSQWPKHESRLIDEDLNMEMNLVMKLASLGLAARNKAAIKIRQPLAEASFWVGVGAEAQITKKHAALLCEELNVKQVRVLGSTEEVVSYSLHPLPKQLGQKYKAEFPHVNEAILALEPESAAQQLLEGNSLLINLNGENCEVLPSEVEVRAEPHSGLAVASEGSYFCALVIELTPELINEGLAREFVRHVQNHRKNSSLNIADRIHLFIESSPRLEEAIRKHLVYIKNETLSIEISFSVPPEGIASHTIEFDGQQATLAIMKVG
jgi:isoleucyl-tRNA synthetase